MSKPRIFAFADEASPSIDQQIAALLRNGMDGLEIRNVDGQNVADISLEKAREVRAKLDDAGLITWSVGSPIGKIRLLEDDFAAHLDVLRHLLEIAEVLGAANMRVFSFYMPEGERPEVFRDEVMERLRRMVEVSAGSGVMLCHENEKGIYGDIAPRCLDIHRSVPELAGVFDPANFIQSGDETGKGWPMLRPYIKYLHVKDALPDGRVVPSGQGVGHVETIVREYLADGGAAMTLEPHLKVFDGLGALEREGSRSGVGEVVYPTGDAAFDAAAAALRGILERIGTVA